MGGGIMTTKFPLIAERVQIIWLNKHNEILFEYALQPVRQGDTVTVFPVYPRIKRVLFESPGESIRSRATLREPIEQEITKMIDKIGVVAFSRTNFTFRTWFENSMGRVCDCSENTHHPVDGLNNVVTIRKIPITYEVVSFNIQFLG